MADDNIQLPEDFAELLRPGRHEYKPPKGYERPGVTWDGATGTVISPPLEGPAEDQADLLKLWGLDPDLYDVVGDLSFTVRETATGKKLWSYRAKIRRRTQPVDHEDVDDLIATIKRARSRAHDEDGQCCRDSSLIVGLSDWQIGKGENGGSKATVERITKAIDKFTEHVAGIRRYGYPVGTLYVLGLGDIIEGCSGFYSQQEFTTDLDRRDQIKVSRRLIVRALTQWAPLFSRVVVAAVGGNHGENRKDGKSYTTFADNDDVALFESVAEILGQNPKSFGHVEFVIPRDELAITLDVNGTIIGLAHSHQARNAGKTVALKIASWWAGQALGRTPIGAADILVTGHYHHLSASEMGARLHIQVPAMDGGSRWYQDTSGNSSPPGMLSFVLHGGRKGVGGWSLMEVTRP